MKRFTVIFSILLVLCFGGTLAYVAATPDFVPPAAAVPAGQNEDPDAPVWDETKEGKKGRKEIRFTTTNDEDSYTYHLTIYPDGTTQIRIQPTRRQSISFNGKMDTDE